MPSMLYCLMSNHTITHTVEQPYKCSYVESHLNVFIISANGESRYVYCLENPSMFSVWRIHVCSLYRQSMYVHCMENPCMYIPSRHRTLIQHKILGDFTLFGCLLKRNILSMFNLWFSINLMSNVVNYNQIPTFHSTFIAHLISVEVLTLHKCKHWNSTLDLLAYYVRLNHVCNVKMWPQVTYRNQRWVNVLMQRCSFLQIPLFYHINSR